MGALPGGDPLQQYLAEIRRAGDRAALLTGQLLAFSRTQIVAPELLDVNVLLSGMRPMVSRLVREDVELRLTLSDEPMWVRVDRAQLERVVMNLAINARDAMAGGGTLAIVTARETVDTAGSRMTPPIAAGEYVRLSLTDPGEGIPEAILRHTFEPVVTTK